MQIDHIHTCPRTRTKPQESPAQYSIEEEEEGNTILCSVLKWRKLSNPVRVSVNVHRATGRTFYTRVRCALCTLAITKLFCWRINMQCEGDRQFSTEQSIHVATYYYVKVAIKDGNHE